MANQNIVQRMWNKINWSSVIDQVGTAIYGIRWGLIPMYLGLWIAIIAYNLHFFREILEFIFVWPAGSWYPQFRENDPEHYLIFILSLIDITMVANLVVMTTVGGYSTFVKEYNPERLEGKPRWMNGLDSSKLKIKMGMSLVGVSAIHLLKTFMEIGEQISDVMREAKVAHDYGHEAWMQLAFISASAGIQIVIHLVFIVTTLAFTKNSNMMHAGEHAAAHADATPTSHAVAEHH